MNIDEVILKFFKLNLNKAFELICALIQVLLNFKIKSPHIFIFR